MANARDCLSRYRGFESHHRRQGLGYSPIITNSLPYQVRRNFMDKRMFKKKGEELQAYLQIMRKHLVVPSKKGKGSYKRKQKHRGKDEE